MNDAVQQAGRDGFGCGGKEVGDYLSRRTAVSGGNAEQRATSKHLSAPSLARTWFLRPRGGAPAKHHSGPLILVRMDSNIRLSEGREWTMTLTGRVSGQPCTGPTRADAGPDDFAGPFFLFLLAAFCSLGLRKWVTRWHPRRFAIPHPQPNKPRRRNASPAHRFLSQTLRRFRRRRPM